MNDIENNHTNKLIPPLSQLSSNQKDPPPAESAVNEGYNNYEMPIAIAVNSSEVVHLSPHAEPDYLEEDIIIVNTKVS